MIRNSQIFSLSVLMCVYAGSSIQNSESNHLVKYLNQPAPGIKPVIFAKNVLPPNNRDVAFSPDGREFYFTQVRNDSFTIMFSKYNKGKWTVPTVAPFSGVYNDFEPCISPNGQQFYFASMRPSEFKEEMKNDIDIWIMSRENGSWSHPKLLTETINTNCMEYYPSVSIKGSLYFGRNDSALTRGDIYVSKLIKNKYLVPKKLPEVVNLPGSSFNAFISSDETFLIFSSYIQDSSYWHSDLFISFKDNNGEWIEPQNMGEQINSRGHDLSPWVSHDGKFFFFASTRLDSTGQNRKYHIFWVDASVIERYKPVK